MTSDITAPGIYTIAAADYHADPCPEPSLNKSTITLLERSPRHAWSASQRLNPNWQPDNQKKYDGGTAAHALKLEGRDCVVEIDAPTFKTKNAQTARDAAYAAGKTPLLTHQLVEVRAMVAAIAPQLAAHYDARDAFTLGVAEQTLIWQESGIWCRARPDWLHDDYDWIDDYKTTANAHPDAEAKRLLNLGADIQAAWYKRGVRALGLHKNPRFRFISQEREPPYALSVIEFNPVADELADRRIAKAIDLWRWCVTTDTWPGYPSRTCFVGPSPWQEKAQMDAELRDEMMRESGVDLKKTMLDWQAPSPPTIEEEIL